MLSILSNTDGVDADVDAGVDDVDEDADADADVENDIIPSRLLIPPPIPLLIDMGEIQSIAHPY